MELGLLYFIILGAGVGFAIGLTGVGGGSLMTPLLIFSGIPAPTAIGTDLLYAALTKAGGVVTHQSKRNIRWDLVLLLAAGSIPTSLLTSFALHSLGDVSNYSHILSQALGVMLIASAGMIFYRRLIQPSGEDVKLRDNCWFQRHAKILTFLAGLFLGTFVTLSSVGAGAFCAVLLLTLYPRLPAVQIIGTDIAHAVPLTLVAGLGHFFLLDNIDFSLLAGLLIGSLPAVYIGGRLANKIPNSVLQPLLASLLMIIGFKFSFF